MMTPAAADNGEDNFNDDFGDFDNGFDDELSVDAVRRGVSIGWV